ISLWEAIKLDVRAFMTRLWRSGALVGRTPEEAFFVKCDEETNPPELRDAGRVETLIGFAPVRPAEFVIFRLAQVTAGAEPA
ncbi:phage tail protein, partial [Rhodovulum sulfidophilum]|nr:phage tail protein [Rhodovulum sulfidophilum]